MNAVKIGEDSSPFLSLVQCVAVRLINERGLAFSLQSLARCLGVHYFLSICAIPGFAPTKLLTLFIYPLSFLVHLYRVYEPFVLDFKPRIFAG